MFVTITTGNYSDALIALCPYQEDDVILIPAQTLQTLFAVGLTLIFDREYRGIEDSGKVGQVNAVILEVLLAFGFVPGNHAPIVVTKSGSRQAFCGNRPNKAVERTAVVDLHVYRPPTRRRLSLPRWA
jgi:hypothetical protein